MNDFAPVTDADYFYVELADGSQGKMNKKDMLSLLIPDATKDDAWIVYIDSSNNRICVPWAEWNPSRTDGVGVAIMVGGRRLMVAPDEAVLYWSSVTGEGGAVTSNTKELADMDYAGRSNTAAIVASTAFKNDGPAYAPRYCTSYSKGKMSAGYWWLPSSGELGMIYSRFNAINAAMVMIGGTPLTKAAYWSSTEQSTTHAWYVAFSNGIRWYDMINTNQNHVRPVSIF